MIHRFKIFGWRIAVSREPMHAKPFNRNRNRHRNEIKRLRLEMAENRCEICGRPIDERCALHRTLPAGEPNRNALENVMVLCSVCHHELEKRPHYHGLRHLEDATIYDTDQGPDHQD